MDAEIIEADFQQFYHLDLSKLLHSGFSRYCRLLLQLPLESRFVQKYSPVKDWSWDKETSSRILHMLDVISCQLANMVKDKAKPPRKPDPQFQPDYVKKAKEEAEREEKEHNTMSKEELTAMKRFWERRNSKVKRVSP